MKKKIKVGFDLDGVILYNPLRFLRPIAKSVKFLKPVLFKQKKDPFYFPKSNWEKQIWSLLHKTSFRLNDGFYDIQDLIKKQMIEAHIITGRYGMLESDFKKWLAIIDPKKLFKSTFSNKANLQPNIFKANVIKKLKLDFYVEDNWDIVEKLDHHTDAKILWITNFLDQRINYPYKFNNLKGIKKHLAHYLEN